MQNCEASSCYSNQDSSKCGLLLEVNAQARTRSVELGSAWTTKAWGNYITNVMRMAAKCRNHQENPEDFQQAIDEATLIAFQEDL